MVNEGLASFCLALNCYRGVVVRRKSRNKKISVEEQILRQFGRRVRQIRELKGFTVYDVTGEDMPIRSRQHWQIIENGKKNIGLFTAYKIARSLKVKVHDLFTDSRVTERRKS